MNKKILFLLITLVIVFVFCGVASAATLKTENASKAKINDVEDYTEQVDPAIDGVRVVWEQRDSSGLSNIYVKNLATGDYGRVLKSTDNQYDPDISGNRIVWEQEDSQANSVIYMKNIATGDYGRVLKSTSNQYDPAISGN